MRGAVLVLDGQTNQALACVRALGAAGFPVFVASRQRWPLAAWSRYCRGSFRLAGESAAGFAPLLAWARARGVTTVMPLTERACLRLDAQRPDWEAVGIAVGCASGDALRRVFDKAETLALAASCRVAIPPTRTPASPDECRAAADALGYPVVVKARWSNALQNGTFLTDPGTAYAATPRDLEAAVLARRQGPHWPLLQRFVPGQGKGIFALCDRGRIVACFAHERLRDVRPSGSGSSLRRSVAVDPRLRAPAERLLGALAWHGPAMVEFRDEGAGEPWLMEINGRFWGSLQLAVAAGLDFPTLWVRLLTGETIAPGAAVYREGVTVRWLWGDVKRLLYILKGRPPGFPGPYPSRLQGLRELVARQPAGTRSETWDPRDPLPALGEWVSGLRELAARAVPNGGRHA